jgi:hypothetical protein
MKKLAFALAAVSLCASASAQVYGSLGLGASTWSGNDGACAGVSVCDREDTSYRAVLGYRFNSWIALEGGYIGFGKLKTFGVFADPAVPDRETEGYSSFDAAGPAIGVAVSVPLGTDKLQLRGRLGLVSMLVRVSTTETTYNTTNNQVTLNVNRSGKTSSLQPYAGLGLGYRFTPSVTLDGSVDVARGKYGSVAVNEKARLMALNVGLTFDF